MDRVRHYFLTYKQLPGEPAKCERDHHYGREGAYEVVQKVWRTMRTY